MHFSVLPKTISLISPEDQNGIQANRFFREAYLPVPRKLEIVMGSVRES